jgi:hypothetical protein
VSPLLRTLAALHSARHTLPTHPERVLQRHHARERRLLRAQLGRQLLQLFKHGHRGGVLVQQHVLLRRLLDGLHLLGDGHHVCTGRVRRFTIMRT